MKKVIGFHAPDEPNGYLSNWYPSPFSCGGYAYISLEQYMMHQKALLFHDAEIAAQILRASEQGKIKELGRAVRGYNDKVWNGLRQVIVYDGLCAKFRQNPELGAQLRGTGSAILAECAVHDLVWGIGLGMHDDYSDLRSWRGQNLLGFTLMRVREQLTADGKE